MFGLWKQFSCLITGRNEVLAKVIFSQACVKNSVHRGGVSSLVGGGVSSKFLGGGLRGEVKGWWWLRGEVKGGPHFFFFFWNFLISAFFGDTPPPGPDTGIRSTFGRYASYWNAFLFSCFLALGCTILPQKLNFPSSEASFTRTVNVTIFCSV